MVNSDTNSVRSTTQHVSCPGQYCGGDDVNMDHAWLFFCSTELDYYLFRLNFCLVVHTIVLH